MSEIEIVIDVFNMVIVDNYREMFCLHILVLFIFMGNSIFFMVSVNSFNISLRPSGFSAIRTTSSANRRWLRLLPFVLLLKLPENLF